MARGTRGSLTRTMIRNIMLMSASAVSTTMTSILARRSRLSGSGMPAMSEPRVTKTNPESTALMAPARLKPMMRSNLVRGVTRYPSCRPRALSSIKMIPPPIMAETKMARAMVPGSRYCM